MKFDLTKALAGHPVKLRDGTKAFIRHHETGLNTLYPLLGYIKDTDKYGEGTWTAAGYFYSNPGTECRHDIVSMWVEPTVFNHWDALNPKWKFIAADENGGICVFTTKPYKDETAWCNGCDGYMYVTDFINFQYTDWEHSLVERPSTLQK